MIRSVPPAELLLETAFLPDDFPQRLERFKEALDVSWDGLAACLGADPRQLQRWRQGTRPCGDSMYALFLLAATFTLVFLALASVICAAGARLFWTSGYYGGGGWDALLLLPIGYFIASVTTISVLFFTRHSKSPWRREGGVMLGVLLVVLLLGLFFFFAVAGSS